MKKIFVFFMLFGLGFAFGQQRISYNGSGNYELVERTDLRRYDNGRYKGLVSREVSAFIIPSDFDNGFLYDGTFWVLENTRRNGFDVDFGVDEGIPAKFRIGADGQMSMIVDNGFPSYRSFPTFPSGDISIGDSWEAQAVRAVDPLYKGVVTRMPVMVRYTYSGDSVFNGEDVFVIDAQWATRYGMGSGSYYIDFGGDGELRRASGSHRATIYVSKASGNSVLIRDNVDETFFYEDGNQIRFKGTVSLFTKYPPAVDRMKFLPALKRVAGLSDEQVEELISPVDSWGGASGGHSAGIGDSAGIAIALALAIVPALVLVIALALSIALVLAIALTMAVALALAIVPELVLVIALALLIAVFMVLTLMTFLELMEKMKRKLLMMI